MSGAHRGTAAALGIVAVVAITAVLAQLGTGQSGTTSPPGGVVGRATSVNSFADRLARQVAELKAESLEQSLANLGDSELWFRPGGLVFNESGRLPLKGEDGARTVDILVSNRRLLKVYQELGALPPARATDLVNRYFPLWFEQYSVKYAKYVDKGRRVAPASADKGEPGEVRIAGWGGERDEDDGLPLLECMRWRLLGLVLIAGNLRLQGTAPWVQKVAQEARAQRDYLYQAGGEFSEPFRAITLTTKSLYNRQVLGYALTRTSPQPELALAVLAAREKDIAVKTLPVYDAEFTPYDRFGAGGPADYSKGSLAVEYVADVSDNDFESIFGIFGVAVGK